MAGKYRRGQTWTLSWVEGGRQHRKSLGTVTEAEAEAARLAKEQALGNAALSGPAFSSWAETYATWHAETYPDSYYRVCQIIEQHLLPHFGRAPLLTLTKDQVETYKRQRTAAGAAAGTLIKELRTLQAIINRAVYCDQIPHNPIAKVPAPKDLASRPPRWYSREELAAIYAATLQIHPSTIKADRALAAPYRWTWQLLANSGLRRAEALHLRWRDIGADEIRVISSPEARTKSGKWRAIPRAKGANEALDALKPSAKPAPRAFVLPQVAPTSLSRAFGHALQRADLDGSIHCLRHTYISHLVMAGIPLRTVQVLAGHASHTTTERYAHLAPSHLRDAISALNL
jgi:integrase